MPSLRIVGPGRAGTALATAVGGAEWTIHDARPRGGDLVRATVDNVAEMGAAAALTGPVACEDWDTVERHRAALPTDELEAYDAMVRAARRLVEGTP